MSGSCVRSAGGFPQIADLQLCSRTHFQCLPVALPPERLRSRGTLRPESEINRQRVLHVECYVGLDKGLESNLRHLDSVWTWRQVRQDINAFAIRLGRGTAHRSGRLPLPPPPQRPLHWKDQRPGRLCSRWGTARTGRTCSALCKQGSEQNGKRIWALQRATDFSSHSIR